MTRPSLVRRRALVTASSRGLGHACALALARMDFDVVLNGRDADTLARAEQAVRAAAPDVEVQAIHADLAQAQGLERLLAAAADADVLVANVGGPAAADWRMLSAPDWRTGLDACLVAPIALITAAVPAMMARGWGRVIAISSASLRAPIPNLPVSNAARAGLAGFMGGIAPQAMCRGVTLNSLLPGRFDTDRQRAGLEREARAAGRDYPAQREAVQAAIPAGRLGDPGEMGAACAFLCSPAAAYITNQQILMDGGAFQGMC
ncbi:Bacilysin biosynthesis oxidoreductase YwfH [Pigmentiphaga humi]|uniref:Bacilysin biosynthesis oxidoreductase YwfH n=1 Tax=Pigmentiphaga humi TaxID=2478468 RepID=A0A3P4B7V2_9BURK|nr:SDR family oxidoreductase [Pigmentiphaga humi]VCU71758.1 Bacilysin biosynthesis oxidoreductase YwfH [Pigmentiphaga humi]